MSDNKAPPVYKKNGTRTYNNNNNGAAVVEPPTSSNVLPKPRPNVPQHGRQVSFTGKDRHHVIPGNNNNTIDNNNNNNNNDDKNNSSNNNMKSSSLKSIDSVGTNNSDTGCTTINTNTSTGTTTGTKTTQMSIPSLHHSLMRTQKKKDPYKYYEVIKIMGDGSMGSVAMVKKRKSAIGGSARKLYVTKEKHEKNIIFKFFPCLLTSFCIPKDGIAQEEEIKDGPFTTTIDPTLSMSNNSGVSGITMDQSITVSNDSSSSDTDDGYNDSGTTNGSSAISKSDGNNKNNPKTLKGSRSNSHSSMISFGGNKKYGVIYALKSIVIDRISNPIYIKELQNEISILKTLDHPNICKAIETYEYQNKLYLVLELCSGGDLYSRDPYTEQNAKYIVRSILDACAYLHKKNITHRDLKYENIMFASPTSPNVKIIDFGLSKKYGKNEILNQTVGTVYTMAPEVIKGDGYTQQCDVWSIGVLAFMLCSSSLPFFGKSRHQVVKKIMNGKFDFKGRRWEAISNEAKDFCQTLLVQNVNYRPDCVESLEHKWFHTGQEQQQLPRGSGVHRDGTTGQIISSVVMDRVQATIQMFSGYTKLKKLALYVIAHKSTVDEIGFLQQLFQNRFDVEKDGIITIDEFKDALKVYSYTDDELCIMFNAVDIDGSNNISYSEFLAATIEAHGTIEEDRIAEAFDRLDSDDDGYITDNNLKSFLGQDISSDFIDGIIDEVDVTNDHRVDYDEFLGLWDGSFDEELERTLSIVKQKRLVRESSPELPLCDEGEHGEFLIKDEDKGDDNDDGNDDNDGISHESDPLPPGASKYYFEQEKEKSMRGVWI